MRVFPFLLPIFLGCSAQNVEYGVDVSFPIHREKVSSNYPWLPHNVKDGVETPTEHVGQPLQPLGDRQAFYNHLHEGCAKKHDADSCNRSEQQRIERNLMRPSAMVNFTTMVSLSRESEKSMRLLEFGTKLTQSLLEIASPLGICQSPNAPRLVAACCRILETE
jgi:hypothetical protein